jgi:hypothetical protein
MSQASTPGTPRLQEVPARRYGKNHGGGSTGGRRAAFRRWRQTRPFWAGLLLMLAGAELLAIPLSGVLYKGAIKLVIYIGIGGVFGVLIGILMITAGIVLWANPAHRVFYSIAGVILGLISFPASNLGGFFIGMLLAMIGGALGFAWTPGKPASAFAASEARVSDGPVPDGPVPDASGPVSPVPGSAVPRASFTPHSSYHPAAETIADGMPAIPDSGGRPRPGVSDAIAGGGPAGAPGTGTADGGLSDLGLSSEDSFPGERDPGKHGFGKGSDGGRGSGGLGGGGLSGGTHRMLAAAAMPAVVLAGLMSTTQVTTPQDGGGCILWVICTSPSSSPSPTASPTASSPTGSSPLQGLLPSASASPSQSQSPSPSSSPSAGSSKADPNAKKVSAPGGLTAPSATSELTTGSAVLTDFNFVGVTQLPVGGGGTEEAMEFTATTASLTSGVHVTVDQGGAMTNTDAGSFLFTNGMTLYTTKLCGEVEGITPNICFTPTTASEVTLKLASVLGKAVPITMLKSSISQPLVSSGQLSVSPMKMGV